MRGALVADMRLGLGTNNQRLREELEEITDRYADDRVGGQIGQITNLALKYPHSISLVKEAIPGRPETSRFNCYQHSFGLVDVEAVNRIMKEYPSVFPGCEFVQFLIDRRLHEISVEDAEDGDHVLYVGAHIEHAGRVREGAIESKWGLAHLWRHGVYEIPWRYGNTVRFFRHISQEDSVRAFLDYAAGRDVTRNLLPKSLPKSLPTAPERCRFTLRMPP